MKLILSLLFAACFVIGTQAAQNVKTIDGVPIANVKTFNGVAIASVKTVDGVDNTGGGGVTPPTFIQEAETTWNNTAATWATGSFAVQVGDVLVAGSVGAEWSGTGENVTITNSGTPLVWLLAQSIGTGSNCAVRVYTTICTAAESITVTFNKSSGIIPFGGNVLTFRGSTGVGASNQANTSGAPSVGLTTLGNNSVVVAFNGDWNAVDGTSRTWRTVNGITPTSGNGLEVTYFRDAANYTVYAAYWSNCGTAGAKTLGLSAPTGQQYAIAVVEIKGT